MEEVVGVRFRSVGKIYYFSPDGQKIQKNSHVIVETARGIEFGEVVLSNRMVEDSEIVPPLKKVLRVANEEDYKQNEQNIEKAKEAFDICQEKIKAHNLDMKLIETEYTFDESKVLFYFTADGRVDFRELVKDLASVFRTRIELRQIGVRDEAKMLGSFGICGRNLCCSQFLGDFEPVSIKMAKEQGLSLNPSKISGTCGRLMCCLKYEQDVYEDLLQNIPAVGSVVTTAHGEGVIVDANLLKSRVKVKIEGDKESSYYDINSNEIKVIRTVSPSQEVDNLDEEVIKTLEQN